ncbi:ABC transporter ATP-binding protein [Dolosigranulum pigrum]|uniref:ABC transporter ATP-binding protein n=1 Tax=Dolosigranulum pigrum TaxID=29394 RepID=UPI001FCB9BB6|nr:ABC transporter ATP-binding protein [Dolosigranulum pigrum]
MMLQAKNLSKKFKGNDFYSVKDINIEINDGEIVGLIGKNGAGKTTLLKMLVKALKPTEGMVYYNGQDIFEQDNLLHQFGIIIGTVFYPHLTVRENLNFYLAIHNQQAYEDNIEKVLKLVDLWEVRDKYPGTFSFGMKQRLCLALSMVDDPKFMILDEPFVGLDPNGVKRLRQALLSWAENRQISIIISSHQLNELKTICGRFLYIEDGVITKEIDKQTIQTIAIELENEVTKTELLLEQFPSILSISADQKIIKLAKGDNQFSELLNVLTSDNQVKSINDSEQELEKYFEERG